MLQALFIIGIVVLYFISLLTIAYTTSKGADNSTYFSGNKKMPWTIVAIAMIGAPISGVTFISVPGMVAVKGYAYLQMCLGFIVGYLIIAWVLVPLFYKHKIISIYGFLQYRFGQTTYKTGAWFFLISKIFGITIRFLIVCTVLQLLVFDPLHVHFIFTVATSIILIWVTTYKGGVKSVIWGDALKSFCLIMTVVLCIYFVAINIEASFSEISSKVIDHESFKIFFFKDVKDGNYFWKQFIAGIFLVVAMTGLDQDMMQRTLACKNPKDSKKNLIVSSLMQCVIILLFLVLGTIMMIYIENKELEIPEKSDNLFATVAFHSEMPWIVGALFILGLISSTYSSVGSAVTAMTTSLTMDIFESHKKDSPVELSKKRKLIHASVSVLMACVVLFFYYLNNQDAISTIYTLASYTYGPILGLFVFGIFSKRNVNEFWVPIICIFSPILCWVVQLIAKEFFLYETSFELLLLNAGFTMLGLYLIPVKSKSFDLASESQIDM